MASNPPQTGNSAPPKPWERAGSSSGPVPFKPPSSGSTSDVVEASGTARSGEVVTNAGNAAANTSVVTRPMPPRPWEQNYGNNYGGYGSNLSYNSGYGSGMYGSYGGYGGSYGGLYGNNMYRSGYGGLNGGSGMYGGMYNNGYGGSIGGYGMGMGGPFGNPDPNNPYGPPSSPPGFWMSFLRVMHGVVNFFGRISVLIDQNTQAFHMFMSALLQVRPFAMFFVILLTFLSSPIAYRLSGELFNLTKQILEILQLFDRSGMLYGELARFVLRLFGIKTKPRQVQHHGPGQLQGPEKQEQLQLEGPKAHGSSWDSVWGGEDAARK
ncbi:Peroxisomal membrane protein 13 [Apostasia shenzhenica]|uniref:Peroxin-13 n=1 Tax=Apostasia shenzhenica TaxID=1088818 RepID=A0A2H9ZR60_9ASPA|nr:Peroxisomal membrane protein 13 [Apostasia shenzhenica]